MMKTEKRPVERIARRTAGDAEFQKGKKILIICDFDGTACSVDMGSMILDRFAGEGWRDIDRAYCVDDIGSREAYRRIAPLFRGSMGQMVEYVQKNASLDPYFADFYRFCMERGYDLKIASDGLDFYIEAVLGKYGLADIEYFSNAATFWRGEGLEIDFPHENNLCGKCGTCKSSIVREHASRYELIIYVGDSYSDICPSKTADIVFAKYILYEKCRQNGTACIYYENFRDVMDYLTILQEEPAMPIYEFECKKCKNVFETLFGSINEKRQVACPACQSKKTERLMSIFGGKVRNTSSGSGCSSCSTTSCSPG